MYYILLMLFLFLLIAILIICIGVAIGFCLSKIIPNLGIELAIVAGAIFSIGIIDLFIRLISSLKKFGKEYENEDIEIEEPAFIFPQKILKYSGSC